eukprot:6996401-Pyramimonas_sp.AAC.1
MTACTTGCQSLGFLPLPAAPPDFVLALGALDTGVEPPPSPAAACSPSVASWGACGFALGWAALLGAGASPAAPWSLPCGLDPFGGAGGKDGTSAGGPPLPGAGSEPVNLDSAASLPRMAWPPPLTNPCKSSMDASDILSMSALVTSPDSVLALRVVVTLSSIVTNLNEVVCSGT